MDQPALPHTANTTQQPAMPEPAAPDAQKAPQPEPLTGAQIIVRSLIKQGVDVVFGFPGGQAIDIYDALYQHADQITHVLTAHEQGAAHAADGYSRATGKVGVAIATSGPGATNLVTGIATAYLDSIPLVAITGNVGTTLLGKDSFQETDIFGITIPVTKHNYIVKNVNDLPRIMAEAFKIAKSDRPGPVLIDVPKDVQTGICTCTLPAPTDINNDKPVHPEPAFASYTEGDLKFAAQMIAACERPYIYCGGGVLSAGASEEVLSFAQHIDGVIACSMMGLTAIPASHRRNLGMTGMHGRESAIRAQDRTDLVIAIGARFSDRATGNKAHYVANKRFLHIDIDPAEIDKNITVDGALVGDMKDILRKLTALLKPTERPAWQHEVEGMRDAENGHFPPSQHLRARGIIKAVREHTNEDTLVVTDVGQHQMWVAQNYPFEKPRTFLTSGGLGTMGFGMGAAIGGCMGRALARGTQPEKTVLFTGDGSFGMNLNELATAVTQRLPLVVIIMNNGVLGMVRQWQSLFFDGRYSNTTLERVTDFAAVARAFGALGERADNLDAFKAALERAFAAEGPFVIDCAIDADDKVFPMIPPGGTVKDMLLE